jgi:hypothetical protein
MSPNLIGALIGLACGGVEYAALTVASSRPQVPEPTRAMLNGMRYTGLVVLPAVGWFIGPEIIGG